MVSGWNAANEVVIGRDVRPGQRIQLAVFGMNGPISNPPTNFIWMRYARLRFTPGPRGPLAVEAQEVNVEVARRHPGLKLHIDHLGRSGGGTGVTDDAAFADLPEMLALAKLPNVAVKMSGAPSYSSQPYPYRNIHGYLRQIFDAFGSDRAFWGTDITRMPCSYRQCVTMFTEELPWLKGRDLERVMGGAIVDWLGWKRGRSA